MTTSEEDLAVLNSLGLTANEAKAFLAMSQFEKVTARELSVYSGLAREVIYQIMPKLLKRGLAEEIATVPKAFRALPMKEAIATLIKRKKEENRELCKKATEILQRHQNKASSKIEDQQISLVPTGGPKQLIISQEYHNVQKSVDLTFPTEKFIQWSQHYAEHCLKEIIKRNVKMRIITEQKLLKIAATHPEIFTPNFRDKLNCINFRYVQKPISVELMIFDKKTILVATTKEDDINKMLWLRTNNQYMSEIANSYFEKLWSTADTEKRSRPREKKPTKLQQPQVLG